MGGVGVASGEWRRAGDPRIFSASLPLLDLNTVEWPGAEQVESAQNSWVTVGLEWSTDSVREQGVV